MRNLTAELQQCNGYQSTCLRTCFGQWGQSRCIPSFDFQSTGEAYWIHPVCLVCPWPRACVYLSTPEPWCVVFVQVSVCVYVSTLNPCTYTVRARVHASSPVPGAVPQQTEHWSSIPRIEVQYSRIQDSRFKVPAQSFPRILNLESWIRGSIELQSSGLNFNTRVLGLLESWILDPSALLNAIGLLNSIGLTRALYVKILDASGLLSLP